MTATAFLYAYPYQQYREDENVSSFFTAYTQIGQQYLDSLTGLQLPVYVGTNLTGPLLDWVMVGLYGIVRPALPRTDIRTIGPYGTAYYGQLSYGMRRVITPSTFYETTDDIYKRIGTWALFEGDGKVFNIRWLKRRVMRFLTGMNGGAGDTGQTYRVSVTMVGGQVTIRVFAGSRMITGSASYGTFSYGTRSYGRLISTYTLYPNAELAPILQSAIDSGVLELPFQFTYDVITA